MNYLHGFLIVIAPVCLVLHLQRARTIAIVNCNRCIARFCFIGLPEHSDGGGDSNVDSHGDGDGNGDGDGDGDGGCIGNGNGNSDGR